MNLYLEISFWIQIHGLVKNVQDTNGNLFRLEISGAVPRPFAFEDSAERFETAAISSRLVEDFSSRFPEQARLHLSTHADILAAKGQCNGSF